jgi:hypothetical protein
MGSKIITKESTTTAAAVSTIGLNRTEGGVVGPHKALFKGDLRQEGASRDADVLFLGEDRVHEGLYLVVVLHGAPHRVLHAELSFFRANRHGSIKNHGDRKDYQKSIHASSSLFALPGRSPERMPSPDASLTPSFSSVLP